MKYFIALAVSIIFTGDILLDRGVRRQIETSGVESLFAPDIDSLFRQADVVVGNLECPVTRVEAPVQKLYCFRGEPQWLDALKAHGFTHLNMANNHTVDQGRRGLRDTWQNVRRAGMVPVGAGENMAEASRPVLLASAPREVWLIASLRMSLENFPFLKDRPCVSQLPFDSLVAQVQRLRAEKPRAVIVVSLHWGAEHTLKPVPQQRQQARRLIDAGADLLVCHHTHTLQTVEEYRGKRIYYSIGNFIFDPSQPVNRQSCVVRLNVTADDLSVETVSVTIDNCTPRLQGDTRME